MSFWEPEAANINFIKKLAIHARQASETTSKGSTSFNSTYAAVMNKSMLRRNSDGGMEQRFIFQVDVVWNGDRSRLNTVPLRRLGTEQIALGVDVRVIRTEEGCRDQLLG